MTEHADLPADLPADLIVTGGHVRLPDGGFAAAVAVRGDRVAAVGTADEVDELRGPRTRVVEIPGGLVLPGFQDSHAHPPMAGLTLGRIDLHDLPDRAAYLDAVAAYAAAHPDETWLTGGGWAMAQFPGGTPRREDLDAVVPDRPVFLYNRDVHGAWVNSRALELAGITRETRDPDDGRIERDPDGTPTGTLHEGAAYTLEETLVPKPSAPQWEDATLRGQAHLHALGITGWQDAWVQEPQLDAYRTLAADGRLTARVVGALWWERTRGLEQITDFLEWRERASDAHRDSGVPGFFPTSVKIMIDGVLENYTGAMLDAYCDGCGGHTDNHGLAYVDRDVLLAAVTELDRLGFQVHMHAIGDRAVRWGLDAVEAARTANGAHDRRHHLAHIQVIHPDDVPRFGALGAVGNAQAYWAMSEVQMEELTLPFLGAERGEQQYPFAALRDTGARLAMGSDWAVSTADPLEQIEVAVTRSDPAHRELPPFLPWQRLTLADAVDAFTAGSAYVNHDAEGGTVAVGARADLAVLDTDVFADGFVTPGRAPVADASVVMTVAGGRVVHDTLG